MFIRRTKYIKVYDVMIYYIWSMMLFCPCGVDNEMKGRAKMV